MYGDPLLGLIGRVGRRAADRLVALSPLRRRHERNIAPLRCAGLARLAALSSDNVCPPRFHRVLVDGQWDNANYWSRYALLRAALGLSGSREVGLIGVHNRERVATAFAEFGFALTVDHGRYLKEREAFLPQARQFLAGTQVAGDIHAWCLPGGIPAAIIYDGILKRQRRAEVDLADRELPNIVAEALAAISAAERTIADERPDLLVISHIVDFSYASLAWVALTRRIPVVALYGDYGTNRFIRLGNPQDLFNYPSRPNS